MTALTRASIARAAARVCFLLILQSTGIAVPQLLAQATPQQTDAVHKQFATMQPDAAQIQLPAVQNAATPLPRKPGVRRIGLSLPANQMDGRATLSDGEVIRSAEAQRLTGPTLETIRLHAILPDQAMAEAQAADCNYVLQSSVSQQAVTASGRFGKLRNMHAVQLAATAAQFIPAVQGAALMTTFVGGQLMQAQMLNFSKVVKANSDVHYEYTLTHISGTVKLHDTETLRSRNNGEDVLTPMLTAAAQKMVPLLND